MQAVQWYAPGKMRAIDVDKPTPEAHEALIRVESVGVCGSDMHYYLDGNIGTQVLTDPVILGHEYAGIVEAVGDDADATLVGQRVAVEPGIPCMTCEWCRKGQYNVCRDMFFPGGPGNDGALCEYITVNAAFCFPVPMTMSASIAAMIEPLAVALHAVELADLKVGETAAIVGLGPIGLLVAEVLRLNGVGVVYGSDLYQYRVDVSRAYGVDHATHAETTDFVEAVMEATQGRGVDVAFDYSNKPEGIGVTVQVTRPAGRCILTGISGKEWDSIPVSTARRRELTLKWCRRFLQDNFPVAIQLILEERINVEKLVTHSFPLLKTQDAYDLVAGYKDGVLKASIDW